MKLFLITARTAVSEFVSPFMSQQSPVSLFNVEIVDLTSLILLLTLLITLLLQVFLIYLSNQFCVYDSQGLTYILNRHYLRSNISFVKLLFWKSENLLISCGHIQFFWQSRNHYVSINIENSLNQRLTM